jgi:Leucine-rich repeat (LRR) protein
MLFFLHILFIGENKIESIPTEIRRMPMLRELWLSKCIFNDTGDTLGTLIGIVFDLFLEARCLRCFFVEIMFPGNNQIESIPSEIGEMAMLQILSLRK